MLATRVATRLRALVRNVFRKGSVDRDLDEELRAYHDGLVDEKVRAGLSRRDAERAARLAGGLDDFVRENVRDVRTGAWVDVVLRDVRFAARSLAKTPGFTLAAAAALALGIGATTGMLSVVRSVLIQPLGYSDAGRLVVIMHDGRNPISPASFFAWRAQTRSFADMAAAEYWTPDLTNADDPTQLTALHVTSRMFPMLGVAPLLGRVFTADEDSPGHEMVVVLSYGLWQRLFAGDRGVIDKPLSLDGHVYRVVGVMPKSFQFAPFWATHAELWAPLVLAPRSADNGWSLRLFARLGANVSLEQARSDVSAVTARLEREKPGDNKNVVVTPLKDKVVGDVRMPLLTLLIAVGFVLLTACANVAHMLLARSAARHRELAVRTALGATRTRLVAHLLSESVLLALLGGVGGLVLAVCGVHALVAASPPNIPRVALVTVDWTVLSVAAAITAVTVIVFGLLPALRGARVDLAEAFRDGDRASSEGRNRANLRNVLVGSEFALALMLLVGTGLMIRSFIALQSIDSGWDPRGVVSMIVSTAGTPAADSTRHEAFYLEALDRVRSVPGVEAASWINHRPIDGDEWGFSFRLEGQPIPRPGESPTATYRVVAPGYFETMRIPILRGRDIRASDRADASGVVVINEFMAKKHWPGRDPVGQRLTIDGKTWLTVIGIAKNDVREQWSAPAEEEFFLPFAQERSYAQGRGASRTMTLVARAACRAEGCNPGDLAAPIRAAIRSVERGAPISAVTSMTALVDSATAEPRFYLLLLAGFAAIAVVLAAVGIYGVMSFAVSRRLHEIGIRIALGARPASVMRDVVMQGIGVASAGAGAGLAASLALTRLMRGVLYGVGPTDALTFIMVTGLLLLVAAVATLLPARRATRVDPLMALRAE